MTDYYAGVDTGRAIILAAINDAFRTTFQGGTVHITEAIRELSEIERARVFTAVRSYEDFTPENDPYMEHDYGAMDVWDVGRICFKIDYYNKGMDGASENPIDTSMTTRVMTIMFSEEQ